MTSVGRVIDKLIEQTKLNKIKWFYLSENEELFEICSKFKYDENLNPDSSFAFKINDGYFTLCEGAEHDLLFIIVPSLDSRDIQCINTGNDYIPKFQQELLRLQNLIKKQFPNVEDFIEKFMDEN